RAAGHHRPDARRQRLAPAMDMNDGGERVVVCQYACESLSSLTIPQALARRPQRVGIGDEVVEAEDHDLDSRFLKPRVGRAATRKVDDIDAGALERQCRLDGDPRLPAADECMVVDNDHGPDRSEDHIPGGLMITGSRYPSCLQRNADRVNPAHHDSDTGVASDPDLLAGWKVATSKTRRRKTATARTA